MTLPHKPHKPTARGVTSPIHESCTARIVGVARGTWAMISDSAVEGLPDDNATVKHIIPESQSLWYDFKKTGNVFDITLVFF